jgi:CRISPR-associated endonuclease/helicase Cas3
LRGGKADDRAWTYDPGARAIIVGTVDVIGSRLLFSGYRMSRWSRSLQAGLIGADTLVVLDEAHLSPAFHGAVRRVRELRGQPKPVPIPEMKLLPLSATPGEGGRGEIFRLIETDYDDLVVARRTGRLRPTKRLVMETLGSGKDVLSETLLIARPHATAAPGQC